MKTIIKLIAGACLLVAGFSPGFAQNQLVGNLTVTTKEIVGSPAGSIPVTEFEVDSTSTSSPRGIMSAQFNTGIDGARFHGRKAGGTRVIPLAVAPGYNLTRWVGSGYDGSNFLEMASIIFGVPSGATVAATRVPTEITLQVGTNATPSVLTSTAVFSSTTGIALTAIGTNQSLTLTPTGTGGIIVNGTSDPTNLSFSMSSGQWFTSGVPLFRPTKTGSPGILDVLANGTGQDSWIDIGSDFTIDNTNGEFVELRKTNNGYASLKAKKLGTGTVRPLVLQADGSNVLLGTTTNLSGTLGLVGGNLYVAGYGLWTGQDTSDPIVGSGLKISPPSGYDNTTWRSVVQMDTYDSTDVNGSVFIARRSKGSYSAPSALASGTTMFTFSARGYGATGFSSSSRVRVDFDASQAWTDANQGTRIRFSVTPNNSTTTSEYMRLENSGALLLNTTTDDGVSKLQVNGAVTVAGLISGVSSPVSGTDAANKTYVDSQIANFDIKDPVVCATTTVLPFSPSYANGSSGVGATLTAGVGVLIIDGYTPVLNDRILVKNQASSLQNGIYSLTTVGTIAVSYVLTRTTDFNQATNILYGDSVAVLQGTTNANQQFTMNNQSAITVGTTAITFAQTSGGSQLSSGNGITITGNSVAINTAVTADLTTSQSLTNKTLTSATNNVFPIGTIAVSAADAGTWLQMNGQVVSQSTYASLFKIIGHQPEFGWTATTVFDGSNGINQVVYGNSATYVAVGAAGVIYTSTDLATWTPRTSGVATNLNAVCWDSDNSLFVAVGNSNVILTSPTGTTWTAQTSGVTSTLVNVIHANSRTVTVGSSGWVSYSTNDTAWTATQPNSGPSLAWLFYANNTWFSAPSGSTSNGIVYSTNGTAWNYVAKPTTNNFTFAGFDATNFYLMDVKTGAVFYSTTGASWSAGSTSLNIANGSATNTLTPVIFSTGVIGLASGTGWTGYTSDGFATVSRIRVNNGPVALNSTSVFANTLGSSGTPFAIAASKLNTDGFAYSVDGKLWSQSQFSTYVGGVASSATKVNYTNGYYILANAGGSTGQLLYAASPYTPSTQFQVPTRTDPSGTALYIKAL